MRNYLTQAQVLFEIVPVIIYSLTIYCHEIVLRSKHTKTLNTVSQSHIAAFTPQTMY